MKRRSFLKGLLGAGAALVAAPNIPDLLVPERKIWALDRTLIRRQTTLTVVSSATQDDDLDNLFRNFSSSVGTSGTHLTWDHIQAAKASMEQWEYHREGQWDVWSRFVDDAVRDSWGRNLKFDSALPTS
jgi:hypothetical protein